MKSTLALGLVLLACRGPSPAPRGASSTASPAPDVPPPAAHAPEPANGSAAMAAREAVPALAPLAAPVALVPLPVAGFGDAVVSLPLGTTRRRPIALALHGNFDRPEWQCEVWRRITAGDVFVLCPRGVPRGDVPKSMDRWEWGSLAKTKAEVQAALTALRAQYPDYVQSGPVVFTGFSLGAILGARLIEDADLGIGAAVLTEGGYKGWTSAKAKRLKPTLRHVLFACGQSDCRNAYRYQLQALLQKAEVPARMVADVKAGHTYDDPVATLIQQEWPAVLVSIEPE